jgi:hypothetical protein
MDVILSREAEVLLRAGRVPGRTPPLEGYLLGHRRGPVYYIERLVPFGPVFSLTEGEGRRIGRIFNGAILGTFTFRAGQARRRRILRPAFYGTLFGQAGRGRTGQAHLDMFRVEYDRKFYLKPLSVRPEGE